MSLTTSLLSTFVATLCSSVALALPSLPQTDANGDYTAGARGWYVWQAIDTDPAGLNCRAIAEFANGNWIEGTYAGTLRNDIQNFPVVKRLPQGMVILTNTVPAGFSIWYDNANKPWVRVSMDAQSDKMCFVRANKRFVKPVYTSQN